MSKSNTFEGDLLALIFKATAISGLADNAAAGALTSLYVALHTADPGEAGTQTTSESAYAGYARVAVGRTATAWTVTGSAAYPMANIDFPTATGSATTITHFSIGSTATGAGTIFYSGSVSPVIIPAAGVVPRLTTATAISED